MKVRLLYVEAASQGWDPAAEGLSVREITGIKVGVDTGTREVDGETTVEQPAGPAETPAFGLVCV